MPQKKKAKKKAAKTSSKRKATKSTRAVKSTRVAKPKKITTRPPVSSPSSKSDRFKKIVNSPGFAKKYAIGSVVILLATTLLWAILGAKLHGGNADQLVNSFLFEHSSTLQGALLPGQHTFLIKWPLFLLIKLFGYSASTFIIFTVGTVLLTVSLLAAVLYRIVRRPLIFGTLCLALASVLLLIPAQPFASGLLPVNMAMLATRNIEYAIYIAGLVLLLGAPRLKSWKFWLSVSLFTVLIASDKLFLIISLGGAFLAYITYRLLRRRVLADLAANWLLAGLLATISAVGILWLINAVGITHVAGQSGVGPYGLAHSVRDVVLGISFGLLGLLTNFGANPAYDTTVLKDILRQMQAHLFSAAGIAFVINGLVFIAGFVIVRRLVVSSFVIVKGKKASVEPAVKLSLMLIWTSIAAFIVFVLSNHYYGGDARYLTIVLFATFISIATFIRKGSFQPEKLVLVGLIITFGILLGSTAAVHSYNDEKAALSEVNRRNVALSQVLTQHPVSILVGDYWRVIPTKLVAGGKLNVMPLSGCSEPRDILSSKTWQLDLSNHSFAYLLSLDESLTDYPNCTLDQIVKSYGRPNASTLIAGNLEHPKELLLFYDKGINKNVTVDNQRQSVATVAPIKPEQLPNTSCNGRPTIMNIVAHQDDDLLFTSPDLLQNIKAGHCIRTVYMTAGDAGYNEFYWLSREQGSEAAYDHMNSSKDNVWIKRIIKIADGRFIGAANPRGNSKITLIFMHLPDGNIRGSGFKKTAYESLARLEAGRIKSISSVDGQSKYNWDQLATALTTLMVTYKPSEIRTQANFYSQPFQDHSDHMAVGRLVKHAYNDYENRDSTPIRFYIGYSIYAMPENVFGQDLEDKEKAFFEYAKYDDAVCKSVKECTYSPASYGYYLKRQYQNPY